MIEREPSGAEEQGQVRNSFGRMSGRDHGCLQAVSEIAQVPTLEWRICFTLKLVLVKELSEVVPYGWHFMYDRAPVSRSRGHDSFACFEQMVARPFHCSHEGPSMRVPQGARVKPERIWTPGVKSFVDFQRSS